MGDYPQSVSACEKSVLILGCGYVGTRLARACIDRGIHVIGTARSRNRAKELTILGIEPLIVTQPEDIPESILTGVGIVLDSIPLKRTDGGLKAGQPSWVPMLARKIPDVHWVGYLSSTGVYGDAKGAWVDESWPCIPTSQRGRERLLAERAWLESGLPVEVFRPAGIYGPGRNIIPSLRAGGYKAVRWQPSRFSSRIHVNDIVAALLAAMDKPRPGRIVNLADDRPLPHDEYVCDLARLVGAPNPVILTPEEGEQELSAAALDFFRDNKRVSNRLLHRELLSTLEYPDFRRAVPELR